MIKVYDGVSNRIIDAQLVKSVDKLFELKKRKGPWAVIAEVVKIWKCLNPKEWSAHLITIEETRKTRLKRKTGSSKSLGTRYLLDVPSKIIHIISILYDRDELPFDRKFWRKFAETFPEFRVPEKV